MIPLRDLNPTGIRPVVTWAIIALAAYVFFFVQPSSAPASARFLYSNAAVPCEVTTGHPLTSEELLTGQCGPTRSPALFPSKNVWWAVVVSMFLHGSIGHLLGNVWVLWIFGNNVEEAFGRLGYVALFFGTGLVAAAGDIAVNPGSTIPVIGASGAIAGVMGAYLALFPGARVLSIVPPLFFLPFAVPAAVFLALWFLGQFLLANQATSIAWEAHVAGFAAGFLVTLPRRRRLLRRTGRGQAR